MYWYQASALWALPLIAIPWIIHWLGRKNAPQQHFSTLVFLQAVQAQLAQRERIRRWILLATRTLALLALILAIAGPRKAPANLEGASAATSGRLWSVVVDNSPSMAYRSQGQTLLENGLARAQKYLAQAAAPGDLLVVRVANGPKAGLQTPAPIDAQKSLAKLFADIRPYKNQKNQNLIDELLATLAYTEHMQSEAASQPNLKKSARTTTLLLVSDMAHTALAQLPKQPQNPNLSLVSIQPGQNTSKSWPGNLAIVQAETARTTQSSSPSQQSLLALSVDLQNFGDNNITHRPMRVVVNGNLQHTSFVSCPAGSQIRKHFEVRLENPGPYTLFIELEPSNDDGAAWDDTWTLVGQQSRAIRVLAINGDPRTSPRLDELFFFERALSSIPQGDAPIHLRIADMDEMQGLDFTNEDVIVLAGTDTLSQDSVEAVWTFVDQGGGLLIAAKGSHAAHSAWQDPQNPLAISMPWTVRGVHQPETEASTGIFIATPQPAQEALGPFAGLDDNFYQALQQTHVSRYLHLDAARSKTIRPLLRFRSGAPALIEHRSSSQGRMLFLTTSLDLEMGDWALSSAYAPFIQRLMRYLAQDLSQNSNPILPLLTTHRFELPWHASAMRWHIGQNQAQAHLDRAGWPQKQATTVFAHPLAASTQTSSQTSSQTKRLATYTTKPLATAGSYFAEILPKHPKIKPARWQRFPPGDLAVHPSLDESDWTPMTTAHLANRLGATWQGEQDAPLGRTQKSSIDGQESSSALPRNHLQNQQRVSWLLGWMAMCMIIESLCARQHA